MRIAEVRPTPLGSAGCSSNPSSQCGNGLEKVYPTAVVRYGHMKLLGEFTYKPGMQFTCGGKVIVQTSRGIEIGEQVSLTCSGCDKSISRDKMREYAERSGDGYLDLKSGKILREATEDDLHEERRMRKTTRAKLKRCQSLAGEHELPIKMVDCEHLFGGERIIFYFKSENRVDFRALVKDLAKEYHTRIEMRQVPARDEARLVADYETCGQECCCKTFLKTLKPINMKMAKMQKATLDPSKVSGRCGRLKCCLRYEHESYEELDKKLPRVGKLIETNHGIGTVVDRQILTQLVQIEMEDRRRVTVVVEDIIGPATAKPAQQQPTRPGKPAGPRTKSGAGTKSEAPQSKGKPGGGRSKQGGGRQHKPEKSGTPPKTTAPLEDKPATATGESTEANTKKRRRRRRRSKKPKKGNGEATDGGAGDTRKN